MGGSGAVYQSPQKDLKARSRKNSWETVVERVCMGDYRLIQGDLT